VRLQIKSALAKAGLLEVAGDVYRLAEPTQWLSVVRHPRDWFRGSAPDTLPVPPIRLRIKVGGTANVDWFLESGRAGADCVRSTLSRHGVQLEDLGSILEFGCGVGRVLRHFRVLERIRICGSDYNATLIRWNQNNLPFAEFQVNRMKPPLGYADETFDLVYAFSVFTHLTEELQLAWMKELRRVLKPRGYLLVTTHGEQDFGNLPESDRQRFWRGEMVLKHAEIEGANFCNAYHPERWVRSRLSRGFTVTDFVPGGALGNPYQDLYVLNRSDTVA